MSRISLLFRSHAAMLRLFREFIPHRGTVVAILFLGIIVSIQQPIGTKVTQQIIDSLQKGIQPNYFYTVPLMILPIFVLGGLAKYFYNTIRRMLSEKVILHLRTQIFEKFLAFPVAYLEERRGGEWMAAVQNDLNQIGIGLDTFCSVTKEPLTFLGLIGMAFYFDWKLAASALLVLPLVAYLFSRCGVLVKRYSAHNLEQFCDLTSLTQEVISGSRIVRVFQLEEELHRKFQSIQSRFFHTLQKSIRVQEIATPAVELVGAFILVLVFLYGGYRISHGSISLGDLLAFVLAIGLSQMPIKQMNNAFLKLKIAEAAAERIYAILDAPIPKNSSVLVSKPDFRNRILLDRVSVFFGGRSALKEISLEVERGQCIGLVGRSGSGKTTLVNLLPRLLDPCSGTIMMDGVDLQNLDVGDLRRLVSFVSQDTFLFHDTILENIRLGKPRASFKEIERAAELAHCTPFIERHPDGFHAKLGDRGVGLSGGERQRIAIARAFLKNAPILILDEATSNLDAQSEAMVQDALDHLMENRTTFLITHRPHSLALADRVVTLEQGKIVEA